MAQAKKLLIQLSLEAALESDRACMLLTLDDALQGRPEELLGDVVIDYYVRYLNLVSNHVAGCNHIVMTSIDANKLQLLGRGEDIEGGPRFNLTVRSIRDSTLVGMFDKFDCVIFPVNKNGIHWSVAVLTVNKKCTNKVKLLWYDSLTKEVDKCFISGVKLALAYNNQTLDYPLVISCPKQPDGWNCGAFACWNMEEILTTLG